MDVIDAIDKRRAYRSLEPVEITDEIVEQLGSAAQFSASCFNNQPWNFVFVYDKEMLLKMRNALSKGNEWIHAASLIIAVFGKKDDDCAPKDREYYLFDLGQAAAFIQLRATELGLVAHPIAGFSQTKTRDIFGIPGEYTVITLLIVGKKSDRISDVLSEKQAGWEKERPERKKLDEFLFKNQYNK